jgi:hypothetical protein
MIGPHIFLQQNRQIENEMKCENMQIAHRHMDVESGTVASPFLFWETCFEFSVLVPCSVC